VDINMQKRAKTVITATLIALMVISQFFFQYEEKAFCATPAEIQEWLDAHNAHRALHGAPSVTWSNTLATSAQAWADTCTWAHSGSGYGENLAGASYVMTPTDVVDLWYTEVTTCPYPYGEPAWDTCWGHFTQVVWKNTTQIGCGYKGGCGGPANIWVCQYNPPGNYIGQFEENVLPPVSTQVGTPASITVPASSTTGNYAVSWGSSSTSGVTYVLEEATNSSFSSGLRTAYTGASTSRTITGRSIGTTYYYRVKATKTGYTDSTWRTGSNGCAVTSPALPLPVTENFNASTLPTGWSTQNTGTGITERWSVSNSANAGGSAYEMKCMWQEGVNSGTTRLITPWINTLGIDQITLSFRHLLDAYFWVTGANLRVQTSNDKSSWTDTGWSVATTSSNIGPATVTVAITTNLNSSTTYVAFVVDGDLYSGFDNWYIDNVSINTILHVSKDGSCGGKRPCYTTIQAAVNAAKDGDAIKVTQGTYNEAPERSTAGTVAIKGGWNSTFTSQTGMTEMHAPAATGAGGVKVQPNVRVIAH
jgi:hypothetical protein